jgi:hypothetical protein
MTDTPMLVQSASIAGLLAIGLIVGPTSSPASSSGALPPANWKAIKRRRSSTTA